MTVITERFKLPEPLPQQEVWLDAPQRHKVNRAGRRSGKSRGALIAGLIGHGPGWREFKPLHPGVAQGWDVIWLAPDYGQAKAIWEEEVKPRTENLHGVDLNNTLHTMQIKGAGKLHIRSAEAIKTLRGLGNRVKGIIVDEGAWMDLQSHMRNVLLPILMDNHGWLIIVSTTNVGLDGNTEQRTPSYFNTICHEVQDGKRDPEKWVMFHNTALDNPVIDREDFQTLVDEYPADSAQLAQEVYAKLLTSGAGLAFPEWREDHHVVAYDPPADWPHFASLDWGYDDHAAVIFFAAGTKDILARSEIYARKIDPYDLGWMVGEHAKRYPKLEYVVGGSDMTQDRHGGETIGEMFSNGLRDSTQPDPIVFLTIPLTPGSRVYGKVTVHKFLKYETRPDPTDPTGERKVIPPWAGARLRIHKRCTNLIKYLPTRPIDPKNSEDVLEGGDDHMYDCTRYGLTCRFPRAQEQDAGKSIPVDRHPGFEKSGGVWRKRPRYAQMLDANVQRDQMIEQIGRQGGFYTGIRWGSAQPSEDGAA